MTEHTAVVRRPRGKGLRGRAARRRKALLSRPSVPVALPDKGPHR